MKRRAWLLSALGATGALVVGWGAMPARSRMGSPELMLKTEGDVALNGWIKIAKDGRVLLAMPRSEMGQGVHTALAMLVAEELDLPLSRVRLEQAGADTIYGNVAMLVASLPFHPLDSEGEHPPTQIKLAQWMVGKVARELGIHATGGSSSIADLWDPLRGPAWCKQRPPNGKCLPAKSLSRLGCSNMLRARPHILATWPQVLRAPHLKMSALKPARTGS